MRINIILFCLLFLTGCFRGSKFESTPIHLNPNMDNQQKYRSLEESNFFADGSTMRKPIEGTVARGMIAENHSFISGKNDDGTFIISNPLELSAEVLDRGQERYNIYCSVCHSQVGNGKGNQWYGWNVAKVGPVEDAALYERAKKFYSSFANRS